MHILQNGLYSLIEANSIPEEFAPHCALKLQYIGSENLSEDIESQITKSFSDLYDESFEIDFLKVNQLPRRKSGKYQLIMNLSQDSK